MRFNDLLHLVAFLGKAHGRPPASGFVIATKMPDYRALSKLSDQFQSIHTPVSFRTIAKSFHAVESAPTRLSRERTSPSRRRGRESTLGVLPSSRPSARIEQLCNRPAVSLGEVERRSMDVYELAALGGAR